MTFEAEIDIESGGGDCPAPRQLAIAFSDTRILVGHVMDRLAEIPDHSVQAVVTSPPYWQLRDYGLEPAVWAPAEFSPMPGLPPVRTPAWADPEAFPSCTHEWGDAISQNRGGPHGEGVMLAGGRAVVEAQAKAKRLDCGSFCIHCGAWLGQLGLEPDPWLYVGHLVQVFREIRRVLRPDGLLWLNLGDSSATSSNYNAPRSMHSENGWKQPGKGPCAGTPKGLKRKDLIGIPWRAAFALQADGWWIRSEVIWAKGMSFVPGRAGNVMPESVKDRPTKAHEQLFMCAPSQRYFYDKHGASETALYGVPNSPSSIQSRYGQGFKRRADAGAPPSVSGSRNLRDVWGINTKPFKGAHFAVFPPDLVEPILRLSTPEHGACAVCGAPYQRVIEREALDANGKGKGGNRRDGGVNRAHGFDRSKMSHRAYAKWLAEHPPRTVGWRQGCECIAGVKPAVVLDPFLGSGTTMMVASRLGLSAIGIEAKAEFADLALGRLSVISHER